MSIEEPFGSDQAPRGRILCGFLCDVFLESFVNDFYIMFAIIRVSLINRNNNAVVSRVIKTALLCFQFVVSFPQWSIDLRFQSRSKCTRRFLSRGFL